MATKMNCGALEDLVEHFNSRLEALRLGVELRDASEDDMCQSMLLSIQSELQQLSAILVLLKTEVAKFKEQLEETEVLKKSVVDLNSRLKYALENIPARLPRKQEQTPPQATNPAHVVTKDHVDVAEQCPLPPRQPVPSQPSARTQNKPSFCVQLVELLTVDDFNSAPKYMRGRLTYDQLNNTVEELNKAYTAKYKLLSKKRTKLNDPDRKKWEKFKSQENKDTAGHYFIVDDDVKTYTSLKIDNTFRNMMTVLRHCGRIKEIRGGGITRYAVLLVY